MTGVVTDHLSFKKNYDLCPESSETDGKKKMSTVYLHSGPKDHFRNSFLLHQNTASSVTGGLWSSPGNHFLECCRAVLPRPCERPELQNGDGLWTLVSVVEITTKKSQGDKSGEYGPCDSTAFWCTDKNSLTDNGVCARELSRRRNHTATGIGKICFTN